MKKTLFIVGILFLEFQSFSFAGLRASDHNNKHNVACLRTDKVYADSSEYYQKEYDKIVAKAMKHRIDLITEGYKSIGGNTESAYFQEFVEEYKKKLVSKATQAYNPANGKKLMAQILVDAEDELYTQKEMEAKVTSIATNMSTGDYIDVLDLIIKARQDYFQEQLTEYVDRTRREVEEKKKAGEPTKEIYRDFLSTMLNYYSEILSLINFPHHPNNPYKIFPIAMKALGQLK